MSSAFIHEKISQSGNKYTKARSVSRPSSLLQRFIPDKIANTGEDPKRKYLEFIKHDIIKSLSGKPIYKKEENKFFETCDANRWALNTAKICNLPDKLPKLQPFKEYNFAKVDPIVAQNYRKNYFKTDHISVKVPNEESNKRGVTFLEKKSNFF
jgi:hypothetical protein